MQWLKDNWFQLLMALYAAANAFNGMLPAKAKDALSGFGKLLNVVTMMRRGTLSAPGVNADAVGTHGAVPALKVEYTNDGPMVVKK